MNTTSQPLSISYDGKRIHSKDKLLGAILGDIERRKQNCYRHLEVVYTTHCETKSEEKQAGIDAFEHVMNTLQSKPNNCTVRKEPEYVGKPGEAAAFNTWHNKWIIYWGPCCPHCGKATG